MQELENLLNSLIQRGWKPWGEKSKKIIIRASRIFVYNSKWYINPEGKHIRSIVSLESGLWQFCVEQNFYKKTWKRRLPYDVSTLEVWPDYSSIHDYQYRLLESALIPEGVLPQFLVENIDTASLKSEQSIKFIVFDIF